MKREQVPPIDRSRLHIPYRRVLDRYGAADEAEDDLIHLLQAVLGPEVAFRWEQDLSHPNPWFHTLILDLSDGPGELSHAQHTAWQAGLRALDLA